jgi:alkylhydroperoxidase/carboxymuconolactone decarboxylase family protein YurZ
MMLDWNAYRQQLADHGASREEVLEALGVAMAMAD